MTAKIPEEFRTHLSLGDLLEEVITKFETGKHKSESEIPTVFRFISQLEDDIAALEKRAKGLGASTLHQIRQIVPSFTYAELGATLSYLRNTLNGSNDIGIIQEHIGKVCTIKNARGLRGTEYRIFLEYIQLFKSEKPVDQRTDEFKEVFSTINDAFTRGHYKLARITKEVDGTWDVFLQTQDQNDPQYALATRYKTFEEKYGIRMGKVEELIEKYVKPVSNPK